MLTDAKIVDGDTLVIWDDHDRVVLTLPLLALHPFNPGICATDLTKALLKSESYGVMPVEELARMAAKAAKVIRDELGEGQEA